MITRRARTRALDQQLGRKSVREHQRLGAARRSEPAEGHGDGGLRQGGCHRLWLSRREVETWERPSTRELTPQRRHGVCYRYVTRSGIRS
jgi:hypothetical protein